VNENDRGLETEDVKITDKRKVDPQTGAPRSQDQGEPVVETPVDPITELTADLQRIQAEYANYRKRVDRDREVTRELIVSGILAEFLPVIDDIGRARTHGELDGAFKSVGEALESTVQRLGMKPFGEPGDEFDPTRHEAIAHEHSEQVDKPTCAIIYQPGYEFNGKIIRAAIVSVSDPN
jgi:molecular chaperone GrpE